MLTGIFMYETLLIMRSYKVDMSSVHPCRDVGINCWYNVVACLRFGPISRNSPSWQQQSVQVPFQTNVRADIGESIVYKSSTVKGSFCLQANWRLQYRWRRRRRRAGLVWKIRPGYFHVWDLLYYDFANKMSPSSSRYQPELEIDNMTGNRVRERLKGIQPFRTPPTALCPWLSSPGLDCKIR